MITNDSTPLLTARSKDADGDRIKYRFQLLRGSTVIADSTTAALASAVPAHYQVPVALPDSGDYRFRVVATDGVRAGAWSPWMGFAIDTVAPQAPKLRVVTKVSTSIDSFAGTVGETPVDVTLSERTGGDRVWGYAWDVQPSRSTPTAPTSLRCGTARSDCVKTVNTDLKVPTFTVPDMFSTFTAWAFDAAGNARSAPASVRFQAMDSRRPTLGHQWRTQGAGASCSPTTRADAGTRDKLGLTLSAGVCRTRPEEMQLGQRASVLRFDGTSGSASTAGRPVVDVAGSFTVAAWARPSALGTAQTVLSQDGPHSSGFELGLNADDEWQFCVAVTSGTPTCAAYPGSVGRGSWWFVAGSYNSSSRSLRLSVSDDGSGSSALSAPVTGTVAAATGELQLGSGTVSGRPGHRWHGDVFLPTVLPGIAGDRQISQVGRDWALPSELCRSGCGP